MDRVFEKAFNSKRLIGTSVLLNWLSQLLVALELYFEPPCMQIVGIYLKHRVKLLSSRLAHAFNNMTQTRKNVRWRNEPVFKYIGSTYRGSEQTLFDSLYFYFLENAQGTDDWNRFYVKLNLAQSLLKPICKEIQKIITSTNIVKTFLRHCIDLKEANPYTLFLLKIPPIYIKGP